MKLFYKIGLFLSVAITSFLFSTTFASSVSAGEDQIWDGSGSVNLVGSYSGLTGCTLNVVWLSSLHIENVNDLATAYIPVDVLATATGGNYNIQLIIKTDVSAGCAYSGDNLFSDQDTMTLCIPNDGFSCTEEETPPASSGGGRSRASRMRDEASKIFATTGSIDKIDLHLTKRITFPNILFELNRNYIGADGAIKYEIEYSTGSDFANTGKLDQYRSQVARRRTYNIYVNDLLKNSVIHYFRARAFYKNKYSKRSNIVDYVNENDPLSKYIVQCIGCDISLNFMDVLFDPEVLIEDKLKTSCEEVGGRGCTQNKVRYDDIFDNIQELELCVEDWECFDWELNIINGNQRRICVDKNNCGTTLHMPALAQKSIFSGVNDNGEYIISDTNSGSDYDILTPNAHITCSDGIKNGEETDVDCGGDCVGCAIGEMCRDPIIGAAEDESCESNVCDGSYCQPCRDDRDFGNIDSGCTYTKPNCSTIGNPAKCIKA